MARSCKDPLRLLPLTSFPIFRPELFPACELNSFPVLTFSSSHSSTPSSSSSSHLLAVSIYHFFHYFVLYAMLFRSINQVSRYCLCHVRVSSRTFFGSDCYHFPEGKTETVAGEHEGQRKGGRETGREGRRVGRGMLG